MSQKLFPLGLFLLLFAQGAAAQQISPEERMQLERKIPTRVDKENKTIHFDIAAGADTKNRGYNFNGFTEGEATITVPLGYTVEISFTNLSEHPHSLAVVLPKGGLSPLSEKNPAFPGAITKNPSTGLPFMGRDEIRFVADM